MLSPASFYELLKANGIGFTTGVPDSLLKDFCAYAFDQDKDIIAANEGGALALATGYHLATGEVPLVYMQNSGFGNIINPLTSLADPEVYSIPMLLMIGWRGEPGKKDEPQHVKQGRVNEALLKALEVPYCILAHDQTEAAEQLKVAFDYMRAKSAPYALLVQAGTFEQYKLKSKPTSVPYSLLREEALEVLLNAVAEEDVVVSTTGKTSREVFELRATQGQGHQRDFLTVGCMGHASQIAAGIAIQKPDRSVFCIDGDGAMLMHLGALAIVADLQPANFRHVLINNGSHESVGGQPTVGYKVDFGKIALGCGYTRVFRAENKQELEQVLPAFMATAGPVLLEVMTKGGSRDNLGRPTIAPVDNKKDFIKFLSAPGK